MNERSCLVCQVSLSSEPFRGHVEFVATPGWGSGFDSVLQDPDDSWPATEDLRGGEAFGDSTRKLTIVICDRCLAERFDLDIVVAHSVTAKRVTSSTTRWSDTAFPKQWRERRNTTSEEES